MQKKREDFKSDKRKNYDLRDRKNKQIETPYFTAKTYFDYFLSPLVSS